MSQRSLYVIVTGRPTCEEDEAVPGAYLVTVDPDLPEDRQADTALDVFHFKVGIEELDPFDIAVFDADGRRIEDTGESGGGGKAVFQGKLDPDDLPEPLRTIADA